MSKVVTGKVRFSYVHVFEPTAIGDKGEKKYNMAVLIDKNDKVTLDKINAAIIETKMSKKSEWCKTQGGKDVWPKIETCLRDGDIDKPDDPNYAGCYFINARSSRKPGLVDKQLQEVIDPSMIYSGCYGRVQLSFFPYDFMGKKGIGAGLDNIQTFNEGEPLGGGFERAEDVFNDGAFGDDTAIDPGF